MHINPIDLLLDKSTDIICGINKYGKFLFLNTEAKKHFDLNNGNFINQFNSKDRATLHTVLDKIIYDNLVEVKFTPQYPQENGFAAVNWSLVYYEEKQFIYCINSVGISPSPLSNINSYNSLFSNSPCYNMIYSVENLRFLDISNNTVNTYGYTLDEFLNLSIKDILIPEDFQKLNSRHAEILQRKEPQNLGVFTHIKSDNSFLKMKMTGQNFVLNNKATILLTSIDVTEQFQKNSLEHLENEIMEKALEIEPDLVKLFTNFIKGLEIIFPEMKASILKIEDSKVWNLASSLPLSFRTAINGQPIGPKLGSCGTAAYFKKTIITTDISTDPLWEDFKTYALPVGLKACWSEPIFNSKKEVIATFANYYNSVRKPSYSDLEIFKRSANLIGLIFENQEKSKELQFKIDQFSYVNQATNDAIYNRDLKSNTIFWGQSYQSLFGHILEKKSYPISNWELLVHPKDLPKTLISLESFLNDPNNKNWRAKYRFKKADGTYAFIEEKGYAIRNNEGLVTRIIGVLSDISRYRMDDLKKEIITKFSHIFNNDINLKIALEQVSQLLLDTGSYSISEIWLLNSSKTEVSLKASSFQDGGDIFYELNNVKTFKIGEDIPGLVWKKKQIISWNYIDTGKKILRHEAALKANFTHILGVPLIRNDEFIGVWVCAESQEDSSTIDTTKKIGLDIAASLASEISRKQLEEGLSHIFKLAPDIICTLDLKGYFKKINIAGCELLEYSKDELLEMNYNHIIYSSNTGIINDTAHHFYDSGKTYRNEDRYITKSGKLLWLDWNCRASLEEGLIYAVAKDVTEKKGLQNLLDDASKMACVGSWELDLKNESIYWSDITREILEADKDYIPTREDAINHYREDSRAKIDNTITQAIKNGTPWDFEFPMITFKGKEKWVRSIGQAEYVNNRCVRLFGSFQDIHNQKIIELKLNNTLAEKREILERIKDSFFAVDSNYIVTYWNKTAEEVLNIPKEFILGKKLWDVFSEVEEQTTYKYYKEALRTGKTVHFEYFYAPLDRWLEVSIYPSQTGASVYFKDISHKKQADEKIRNTNILLKDIAWHQSHSVRAPVARLMSIIDLIKFGDLNLSEKEEFFNEILNSAEEIDLIIRDITRKTNSIDFGNQ